MATNRYKGKVFSFWQLLKNENIEIPIIQRDYAQGREDKQELRGNFLSALYNSLNDGKAIKLDFVYGSKEAGAFQPLDGQQRLTTLFLLHWYAALKEQQLSEENIQLLRKFSYETRASSRDFCSCLVVNKIFLTESVERISDVIKDSPWFFLSWKKDPTIDAMLRAIDDIHTRFRNLDGLWRKLTAEEILIGFYHVELEDIGLTDDLYIKMNARGKLLTSFENFKAGFIKYIKDNRWEITKDFVDTFACKVDTVWTDLFWKHRKNNQVDESFMRFLSTVAMVRQVLEKSDERFNNLLRLQGNPDLVRVDHYSESGFVYLCECLDIYHTILSQGLPLHLDFPLWQHTPQNDIFSALVYEGLNASYTQKVLFYAQTEYLRRVAEFDREKFLSWMRVIRNIVSRGDVSKTGERPAIIRSPQTFDGVINLIHELSEGCDNIYEFLGNKDNIKSSFAKEQIEEEKLKAHIISVDPENRDVLYSCEDRNLFMGRVEFALFCIDYEKSKSNFDKNALEKVDSVVLRYFEREKISNSIRRALLTIPDSNGEYKYYEYWWSFSNAVNANKRCLIDKYRELEYYIYGAYKNRDYYRLYVKELIKQLINKDIDVLLSEFIPPTGMPNWKVRLIKEPSLLDDKCKSNYIAIPEDESCCYLLRSMRPRDINACEKVE